LVEKSATADADRGLRPPWRARSGVVVGCIGLALGVGRIAGIERIIALNGDDEAADGDEESGDGEPAPA
jgi:hypothetical protein